MAPKDISRPKRGLGAVAVAGASMKPTYLSGDWLVVVWGGRVKSGQIVVVERENQPGVFLIKRLISREGPMNWVEGDNKAESTDSRHWGSINDQEIVGRVLFRYRRARWHSQN